MGWKYRLSYSRGLGVKSWTSKIYIGNPENGFKVILTGKKDIFPMLLASFGTFLFPKVETKALFITGQSLIGYDGKTFEIEYDKT